MKRAMIITAIFLAPAIWSCTQTKQAEPVPNRAKVIQPRDMGQEPVALAHTGETSRHLQFPIYILGGYPNIRDCAFDRQSDECVALWRHIKHSWNDFSECMEFKSSEELPKFCGQCFEADGDGLVTLADFAFFDAFAPFRPGKPEEWNP